MLRQAAKLMEEDKAPHSRVGYYSLTNAGYSKTNPPADINAALAAINQKFIEFWDKQFVDAGIPCSRLYTHVAASAAAGCTATMLRYGIVFNPYARPGWTTYPVGTLKNGFQPLYDELAKHGNPAWGGVEANALSDPIAERGQVGKNILPGTTTTAQSWSESTSEQPTRRSCRISAKALTETRPWRLTGSF